MCVIAFRGCTVLARTKAGASSGDSAKTREKMAKNVEYLEFLYGKKL